MKCMLTTLAATLLLAATSAQAASFTVATDKASYLVGEIINITVTVDVGAETVNPFSSYGLTLGWDDAVADVANADVVNPPYGASSQNPILAGLSGSTQTPCANTGNTCTIISQVNASFSPVNVGPAQIIGTLELEVVGLGVPDLQITSFSNNGSTDPSEVIWVVPEPTTAALLALGVTGLALARRRFST